MVRFQQLAAVALIFVVGGIALGVGAEVLGNVMGASTITAPNADASLGNSSQGLAELGSWMPTIGLVIAASIIIGVIFSAFMPGRSGV